MAHAKATFEMVCSGCHDSGLITSRREVRQGWQQIVDQMLGYGLAASDEQVNEIVEYLSRTYAP